MEIVVWPNPILERVADPVEVFDEELDKLVDEMFATMYNGNGIGLAAPQVGVAKRLFVMDTPGFEGVGNTKLTVINPKITDAHGQIKFKEGCLSFPNVIIDTVRYNHIDVLYEDRRGNEISEHLEGIPAICFQHEMDHLNGKTFLRFLSEFKRKMLMRGI